jgi:membrane protease YdiL (CAAX protease family)
MPSRRAQPPCPTSMSSHPRDPPPSRPFDGAGGVGPAPPWPLRAWRRLPAVVRGILAGELVVSACGLVPALLMLANLKLSPRVPWLLPATAAWLWLCWRYLDGWGWPQSTAAARRRDLRARSLPGRVWGWALGAGTLGIASVTGLAFLTPRLAAIPREAFKLSIDLTAYPPWTTVAVLLAISATAGVVEEAGFRGYMLSPIERRHGWVAAILIVGFIFFLDHHLSHAYATFAFLPFFMSISAVHGLLVYCTRSILPSVVLHAVADALILPVQYGLLGNPPTGVVWQTGLDGPFVAAVAAFLVCGIAAVPAFRRLAAVAGQGRPGVTGSG